MYRSSSVGISSAGNKPCAGYGSFNSYALRLRVYAGVEYGYSILGPVSKRTFVKWCFLEKEKDFPTHLYYPYSFLS